MEGLSQERWEQLAEGNATQARKRVAADMLIRDTAGRVLLVDPTYKPYWDLPGGMAEANESPRLAAEREVREELGVEILAGSLLVLEWVPPRGPWDDLLAFVFDGGTVTEAAAMTLHVIDDEIRNFAFVTPEEARTLLRSDVAGRLTRALEASDTANYHENS